MISVEQYETGVRELTREQAESLTRRIRVAVDGTWELIREAYFARVWEPMGYSSWDAYADAEFAGSRIRLPREDRREVVQSLRDAGLSIRAIAAGIGVARNTVRDDLREVGQFDPPADQQPVVVDVQTGEVIEPKGVAEPDPLGTAEVIETVETVTTRTVTGLDGKTYQANDTKPRRSPITDQSRTAGWELAKAVERIERILADDRFQANKAEVATHLRSHLTNAIESCQGYLDRINN